MATHSDSNAIGYEPHRLHTHEMETGVTEALQRHVTRHVVAPPPVSQRRLDFEHRRPRWFREMAAEASGVFFYVYPGIASTASFFTNETNPAFGSLFQIGWAYAIGIVFAIIIFGPVSGGHFHPAITICLAVWQGFPWKKVPYYIFAQVFGSFMAALVLVAQYHEQLMPMKAAFIAKGLSPNSLGGPGSVLISVPGPTQTNHGYLFCIEFFVGTFLTFVIWTVLDPANPFVTPGTAPFIIGLAFGSMVWGFADVTIATNSARDLGTRIVAAIFFGKDAFQPYSAIYILGNIPAALFATTVYELVFRDSMKKIAAGHLMHEDGEEGLMRHLTKTGTIEGGTIVGTVRRNEKEGASERMV
ncbi:hypothetical protein O988_00082 [Pseudogymnoascus sp. VKM F-3808]|nr:hypothetical protein O988_00082 [Pseudogymnoascus sp. VKM F-3808]